MAADTSEPARGEQTIPPAILTRHLRKTYGEVTAVSDLNLSIPPGQFFGLLGRNGSGKTTTLHMLSTLLHPSSGTAMVAGQDVVRSPVEVRRAIGVVFQESALDRTLTVTENMRFAGALCNQPPGTVRSRTDELLDLFGLADKRHTRVGALSGGMRRALDIARGLLHRPQILLLDEPTIGLDVINRRAIWGFLERLREQQGVTVVLTTHYLEEAEACQQVVFMRSGDVIGSGAPPALIRELGAYILEVEAQDAQRSRAHLAPLLGAPISEGRRMLFRIADEDFPLTSLQQELKAHVRSLLVRRPDLNDVYVWINRATDTED